MNGILCIHKPADYTSFDVVARLRGMAHTKRVGHSGTLDPMATGVLPVFLGTATKIISLLPDDDKAYAAAFRLGCTTDTQDSSGTQLTSSDQPVSLAELQAVLPAFRGEILQLPPMYSAVRVNGQRLYDLARQGKEVERTPRPVTIYELELVEYDEASRTGRLHIACSKGTYIRTIIHDIGQRLGTGGIMTALERTRACGFTSGDCITLEEAQELAQSGGLEERLLPIDRPFAELPELRLSPAQTGLFRNGVKLDLHRTHGADKPGRYRVYGADGAFLGLASPDMAAMELRIDKMLAGSL